MLKSNIKFIFLIISLSGLLFGENLFNAMNLRFFLTPEEVVLHFSTQNKMVAEDMIMDPLILSGDKIVPIIIKEIKSKNFPRRLYAISFLGDGSYIESLPTLKKILTNVTEHSEFRGMALLSIYKINNTLGTKFALQNLKEEGFLGNVSKMIINKNPYIEEKRSYLEAFFGVHY